MNQARFSTAFTNSYGRKAIKPKLIAKGLNLLDACLDSTRTVIPGKSTLMVTARDIDDLKCLLCILNSPIASFYLKQKYLGSSYNQGTTFTKDMINALPIPELLDDERQRLLTLVDSIIDLKTGDQNAVISHLEEEVTDIIINLYGLSEGEIRIVKENA